MYLKEDDFNKNQVYVFYLMVSINRTSMWHVYVFNTLIETVLSPSILDWKKGSYINEKSYTLLLIFTMSVYPQIRVYLIVIPSFA